MAFLNGEGKHISFECSALIAELQKDIAEFGGDKFVDVIAEIREGVTIYKDYFLHEKDAPLPELLPGEFWRKMTASALMVLYEEENSLI